MGLNVTRCFSTFYKNILLCFIILDSIHSRDARMCRGGRDDVAQDGAFDESIYLNKEFRPAEIGEKYPESETSRTTFLNGQRTCPEIIQQTVATCPSYFKLNYNRDRKPNMIVEAHCSCSNCLSSTGLSTGRCSPLYYFRHVKELVRRPKRRPCYRRVVRKFSVGCECIGGDRVPPDNSHSTS